MSEDQASKNTDTVLHEDVDCRIILTAQHSLGIDVGGTVIVRSPLEWHRMASRIGQLERQIIAIREIGRDDSKGDRDRIIDMRGAACLLDIDEAKYSIGTNSDEPLDDKAEAASTAQDRNGAVPGMQPDRSSR